MTDEQTKSYIASLTRELEHYERYGNADRAKQVRAELRRLGDGGKPPAKRATKLARGGGGKAADAD